MSLSFSEQFERPEGWLGQLAGKIMSLENRTINKWTLDLLHIQPEDRVLEVGFGPGFAIELAGEQFPEIQLDGVDVSDTMKNTAASRNKKLIDEGRLHLFVDDIARYKTEKPYDKVFSVNNYPLWAERQKGLAVLYSLMKPGGQLAITVQPREEDADEEKTKQLARTICHDLEKAGFSGTAIHYKDVRPVLTVCVTAVK
ncbi:methyltransferase domain-containing protein [Bacillus badius]|uniref:class I SAM-dependent methyltransferase n=1 Tax=Bacillus badius TaxID=1455 RepID=UPI001CBACBE7|nr:methyltransferase domain-containing protein [Bacillus badius]UAT32117.1 methyltransferase domain-containing protein [Bacillus badius]